MPRGPKTSGGSVDLCRYEFNTMLDVADAEVYRAVIRRCDRLMDRAEALLAEHPELARAD